MRSLLATVFVWLGLAIAWAQAVPARPLYEPPPPPTPPVFDLRGTTWFGKTYEQDDMTLTFESDGKLTWSYNGNTFKIGSWKSEGRGMVWWEMNDKYCEFRGSVSPEAIHGDSWNVTGLRWKTNMRRVSSK